MKQSTAHQYAGKHVVITGGLGFIGSNLAIKLVQAGALVTIVDARIENTGWNTFNIEPIKEKVSLVHANIHSKEIIPLIQRAEFAFNLAGVLSHVDALKDPLHDLQINTMDQLKFLLSCLEYNPDIKIIYTGTRNQYGRAKQLPVTEDHPFDPIDTNGISEIAAELYHTLYWKLYQLQSTSIRLCNVFGPRHQMHHSRQGVLNWFIRLLLEGKEVPLMGGGEQIRDCVYVDDIVEALLLLGIKDDPWGQSFNIGAFPISLKTFVETAIEVLGKGSYKTISFPEDRRRIEPGDYVADYSKLTQHTGWKPRWELKEAIEETIRFYKNYQDQYWSST